jgi:hypothetical protein
MDFIRLNIPHGKRLPAHLTSTIWGEGLAERDVNVERPEREHFKPCLLAHCAGRHQQGPHPDEQPPRCRPSERTMHKPARASGEPFALTLRNTLIRDGLSAVDKYTVSSIPGTGGSRIGAAWDFLPRTEHLTDDRVVTSSGHH